MTRSAAPAQWAPLKHASGSTFWIIAETETAYDRAALAGLCGVLPDGRNLNLTNQPARADVLVAVADRLVGPVLKKLRALTEVRMLPSILILDDLEPGDWLSATELGVAGALQRSQVTPNSFADAVLTVATGGSSLPRPVHERILRDLVQAQLTVMARSRLTASTLQPRELAVLELVAQGLTTVAIATELNYSERTVKKILNGMLTRLNLRNRSHALAFAMRAGML